MTKCYVYLLLALTMGCQAGHSQLKLMREKFPALSTQSSGTCSGDGQVCASKATAQNFIEVSEASTGRTLQEIPVDDLIAAMALTLSQDGNELAFGYGMDPSKLFRVWDVGTGHILFSRVRGFVETNAGSVSAIAFSKDGKYLALATNSGLAEVWDANQWRMIDSIEGFSGAANELDLSDGRHLTLYFPDGSAQGWTIGTREILSHAGKVPENASVLPKELELPSHDPFPANFELTSDDRLLLPGHPGRIFDLRHGVFASLPPVVDNVDGFDVSAGNAIGEWDWTSGHLVDGNTLKEIEGRDWETYRALAVSRDGRLVAVKRGTKVAIVHLEDKSEKDIDAGEKFEHVRFSADGAAVIVSGEEVPTHAFAVVDGKPIWLPQLYGGTDIVSDDLRYAAQARSSGSSSYLRLVDVQRRRGICELPIDAGRGMSFSTDGKLLAVPLLSGTIDVLDVATQRRVAALSGFPGDIVSHVRFTSDGRHLVASGAGSFIRIWDLASQTEILSLSIEGMDWAAFTPSGYYDGTDGELKNFYWVRGSKTVSLSSEAPRHRVPGLVQAVWRGGTSPSDGVAAVSALSPPDTPLLTLVSSSPNPDASGSITVVTRLRSTQDQSNTVLGTRNGVPLHPSEKPGEPGTYVTQARLENGSNRIVLWAEDSYGRTSSEVSFVRNSDDRSVPKPEIVVRASQKDTTLIAFSRDGWTMATSAGHKVTVWDMRTRRQVRTILDHSHAVTNLEFGASGDTLASSAPTDGIRIWDTRTGHEVCRIATLSSELGDTPFAFSADGERLAVADSESGLTRLFRTVDCSEEASFESGRIAPAWSKNGGLLIQASKEAKDQLIALDLNSGGETQSKAASGLKSIAALADGSALLLLDNGMMQIRSAAGDLQPFSVAPIQGDKIEHVVVSPEGRVLLDSGKKQYLFAPDLKTLENSFQQGYLSSESISADDRWVGFVDTPGELAVFNRTAKVKENLPVEDGYGAVTQLVFSASGDVLASGRGSVPAVGLPGSSRLLFWDIATSSVMHAVGPLIAPGNAWPTQNWILTPGLKNIGVVALTAETMPVSKAAIQTMPLAFEVERRQNGQLTFTKMEPDQTQVSNGIMPVPESQSLSVIPGWRLSGNASTAALAGVGPGELRVVDLANGKDVARFRAHPSQLSGFAVSSDGALLLTFGDGTQGNSVRMWKRDGTPLWHLEGQTLSPHALAFSDDSKVVAVAGDGKVLLLDARTGLLRKTLEMEPAEITALAFSPDDTRLAIGTNDGLSHLYDCGSGQRLVTLAAEEDGTLEYTPSAFYSGTLSKSTALSFRLGDRVYPLRQFDLFFNRPDVLMQAVAPQLQSVINAYKTAYEKRLQEAKISPNAAIPSYVGLPEITVIPPATSTVESRNLALPVSARSVGNIPLTTIEVRVNGVPEPVIQIPNDIHGRKNFETKVPIVLSSGTNQIEVTAIDAQQRRSLAEQLSVTYTGKSTSTLYLVPVGISNYANQSLDLGYADKDAVALAKYFNGESEANDLQGRKSTFDKIVVTDAITNENATRANILKAGETLAKADVDDTVVMFFAGHGVLDAKLDFYFAPYDMDFADPGRTGISIPQMESILSSSRSRKRLLLVDACHSGELDKSGLLARGVPKSEPTRESEGEKLRGVDLEMNTETINAFELLRSLFIDLRQNSGTEIISASRGSEVAHEYDALGHGVFTSALLDGLKGGATDSEGHVAVSDLMDFVATKVRELSHGSQTPTQRQQNLDQDFLVQ